MKSIDNLIVDDSFSLRRALECLQDTARGALLLVDSHGGLRRTVTDGDIRRQLLAGFTLDSTLGELEALEPKMLPQSAGHEDVLALMDQFTIDHVPIVDDHRRPVALLIRREIARPILLSTPHLSVHERAFVDEAFASNWIAPLGPNVDAFEQELSAYVGSQHGAAVVSGTAAIHLALCILDIGRGDTVFSSSLTFVASANPILYVGATPVFIDSEPESWNMSPVALSRALREYAFGGRLPKAVIVVNLYGQSADYDSILKECGEYGVPVIEDAAESLGATYKGRASGTLGEMGIYSFNGNKIITTSGGGMLVSHNAKFIERARFLSTQARDPFIHYEHTQVGFNYRMSNILAGIGRGQLKVLEDRVEARREVFHRYRRGLAHIPTIQWMPEATFGRSTHWLTACTLDTEVDGLSSNDLISNLGKARIEARPIWKPMHAQPLFAECRYYPHEDTFSVSDDLFCRGVCLPSGSNLTTVQQDRIIGVIENTVLRRSAAVGG